MTDVETDAQVVREALEWVFDIDEHGTRCWIAALDRILAELAQVRETEKRTGDFGRWSHDRRPSHPTDERRTSVCDRLR